jgi:hypothetical protein
MEAVPELTLVDGLMAGGVAGLVQAVALAVGAALTGQGPFSFFILMGYIFRPYAATPDAHALSIVRGILAHIAITILLGGVFAMIARWLPLPAPMWMWGVLYGILVWAVGRFFLLAIIAPTLHDKFNTWLFLVTHFVYGGMLGLWLQRS